MSIEVKLAFLSSNPPPPSSLSSSLVWELPGYAIFSNKPRRVSEWNVIEWYWKIIEWNVYWMYIEGVLNVSNLYWMYIIINIYIYIYIHIGYTWVKKRGYSPQNHISDRLQKSRCVLFSLSCHLVSNLVTWLSGSTLNLDKKPSTVCFFAISIRRSLLASFSLMRSMPLDDSEVLAWVVEMMNVNRHWIRTSVGFQLLDWPIFSHLSDPFRI